MNESVTASFGWGDRGAVNNEDEKVVRVAVHFRELTEVLSRKRQGLLGFDVLDRQRWWLRWSTPYRQRTLGFVLQPSRNLD